MGRAPCCDENGLKKGSWTPEEDQKLVDYIQKHGHGSWRALPKQAGLMRCGKSCRLRWTNYLRPDIKRGKFSFEEEQTILRLHAILGNKWSAIAAHLPGRTDNEIKNYWNTHLKKRLLQMGIDPTTHRPRTDLVFAAAANSRMSPFLAASSLNRMAPWIENAAKLEAEARLLRYYSKLVAAYRSSTEFPADAIMNAENIINADLNLLSNSCRSSSQFDHDANSAAPPHVWAPSQQAGLNAAFDYNALINPQVLESIQNELNIQDVQAAQPASNCSGTNNTGNYINLSQGSAAEFMDNMRSVALGKLCSTPLTQMDRLFANSDDHDLPMSNFKFAQRSDQSIPLSDSCITDDHKSINTMPALISPRNIFSDPADNIAPEINPNSCYGGALPPELLLELNAESSNLAKQNIAISSAISTGTVTPALWSDLNSEDCKDYWSNVLNQTACSWGP